MLLKAHQLENETIIPENVSDEFFSVIQILKEHYRNVALKGFMNNPPMVNEEVILNSSG